MYLKPVLQIQFSFRVLFWMRQSCATFWKFKSLCIYVRCVYIVDRLLAMSQNVNDGCIYTSQGHDYRIASSNNTHSCDFHPFSSGNSQTTLFFLRCIKKAQASRILQVPRCAGAKRLLEYKQLDAVSVDVYHNVPTHSLCPKIAPILEWQNECLYIWMHSNIELILLASRRLQGPGQEFLHDILLQHLYLRLALLFTGKSGFFRDTMSQGRRMQNVEDAA